MHAQPRLIRLALFALLLAACSSRKVGEVLVVVSTDMALPADLDSLDWKVTRNADPMHPQHGSFPLSHSSALPATLAIVAENGEETVLVSLDGKRNGSVRVHREAQLTVPAVAEQMLQMPLNWLCSEMNPALPCAPGMTCQAGQCVSSQITEPLADYAPLETSSCFDVQGCTLVGSGWRSTPPTRDAAGDCIMDANTIPVGPVNVALVVDTARVGNAGVCVPSSSDASLPEGPAAGQCFVPVNQDNTPDGWQFSTDDQQRTVIRLPPAVCDAVDNGAVRLVALTRAGCPIKTGEHPLCDELSVCVEAKSSCPSTFPDSWSGYSCSGTASPSGSNPSLTYCPITDSDPEVGPVIPGHVCCTAGQAPGTDPLLIDDMSGGPLIKLPHPPDESAGHWFTATDDVDRPLSPPQAPGTLFPYRAVDPPVTPEDGVTISSAACFRMRDGFSGDYALEGFSFFLKGLQVVPVDVTPFTGLTFWATLTVLDTETPAPLRVVFPNSDTDTEHSSSTCLAAGIGKTNCNHFGQTLPNLSSDWQKFTVTWDQLTQSPDFGEFFRTFDHTVYSIDFEFINQVPGNKAAPFDFCVSQISFTQ